LTHYLEQSDFRENAHRLTDYGQFLSQNMDSVTAATKAFGDLNKLQTALEGYIRGGGFRYFRMTSGAEVDDSTLQVRTMGATEADAVRADFLAYNGRLSDAKALLDHILQEDQGNVSAHESMGFLEFRQGHMEEAKRWYAQAVKLDSQSYLAHYYYAAMSMNGVTAPEDEAQVESSFRAAIKLNPAFGPAYNALAIFLGQRHIRLDEARLMALSAVQLEPANLSYRLNTANVLMQMERGKDAVAVIRNAMHLAKTPEEEAAAAKFLQHAEEYAQMQEESRQYSERVKAEESTAGAKVVTSDPGLVPRLARREDVIPRGPHRFMVGVLKDVHCDNPGMELKLVSSAKTLDLHSGNYFKIQFSALNFKPAADLNPCADLEGRPAKVEYVEAAKKDAAGFVVGIEIRK
jgi:Tfp pilus assembly protein PilF